MRDRLRKADPGLRGSKETLKVLCLPFRFILLFHHTSATRGSYCFALEQVGPGSSKGAITEQEITRKKVG